MKLFVFRCRGQHQLYAATRFETGSDLPAERCAGGWEFVQVVNLSDSGTAGMDVRELGVDVRGLRQGIKRQGWHCWESRRDTSEPPAPTATSTATPAAAPMIPAPPAPAAMVPALPTPASQAPASVPVVAEPELIPVAPPPPPRPIAAPPPRPTAPAPTRASAAGAPKQPPAAAASSAPPASRPPAAPGPSPRFLQSPPSGRPASSRLRPAPVSPATPVPEAAERTHVTPPATAPSAPQPAGHRVVWFDIPVRDLDRAMRFYAALLDTPLHKEYAGPAVAIVVLPHTDTTIGGCLVLSTDMEPGRSGPLLYLNAQGHLDAAVAAAQANGGTVLQPKHSIGPYGYRAILLDSEGNRIALHST